MTIPHFGGARGGWRPRQPSEAEAASGDEALGEVTGDLYINDAVYFSNVPEQVWQYELGGYPVLKKWLAYRDARRRSNEPLTLGEKDHLREMVQRIAALLEPQPQLNSLYERASSNCWTRQELGLELS